MAINEAGLGSLDDLVQYEIRGLILIKKPSMWSSRCTKTAQILKPARHAAEELLLHLKPDIGG